MEIKIDNKKIIGTFLVIFSIGVVFYGAYYFGQKNAQERYAQELSENTKTVPSVRYGIPDFAQSIASDNSGDNSEIDEEPIKTISEIDDIKKGDIDWNEPRDIGDLGLTNKQIYSGCKSGDCGLEYYSSGGVKYVKSGEIKKGRHKGYDFIVVSSNVADGPFGRSIFRILKKDNNIIFLFNEAYGISQYMHDTIEKAFTNGLYDRAFNNKITVEELDYPKELKGENKRQRFEKIQYINAFFTDDKLKKVFVDDKYGQVWMTDQERAIDGKVTKFELNSYVDYYGEKAYEDVFDRGGFYLKSPDGTVVAYKLKLDIFDVQERVGILDVIWNNGEKNNVQYEENPSGCGGGKYVYDETLEVNVKDDLVSVGKTSQGDSIYGYKDTSSEGFKKLYDEIYWVENGGKKKAPKEFLKDHPKVFWIDPFGRVLAFYNTTFISPAECGKPVIYLYPEKPMNVSVKVTLGNGLSFTEPEYGTGWNVYSDTKSNLTNLSDGKKYPYLFWEGSGDVYYQTPEYGFVVLADELDEFFNSKLAKLGLIEKEIADFKEFWVPKMQESQKPYYFVTFLSQQYINQLAPLSIDPKPDTIIRVLMDYRGLDSFYNVPELRIKTPERIGFTAVEWGGMIK
jgi:hypothetical protein